MECTVMFVFGNSLLLTNDVPWLCTVPEAINQTVFLIISIWTGAIQPYADLPPETTPIAHLDLMQSILALSMIGLAGNTSQRSYRMYEVLCTTGSKIISGSIEAIRLRGIECTVDLCRDILNHLAPSVSAQPPTWVSNLTIKEMYGVYYTN